MAKKKTETIIPQQAIDTLARCLLPEIEKFFGREAGKQEFAEWKQAQQSDMSKSHN